MSSPANPLSEGDIATTNVFPAFVASLRAGATEAELEAELGWTRARLKSADASVTGESTYRHMELMFSRGRFAEFAIAAAREHDASSLGVVGLACRSMPDVGSALACHARFQRLTNRSATYETTASPEGLFLREHRASRAPGAVLISEYTMLVTLQLLRLVTAAPLPLKCMYVRRALPETERALYAREAGAPVRDAAPFAQLLFDPSLLRLPVVRADAELERYFRDLLERALPRPGDSSDLVSSVRAVLRTRLQHGHPTLDDVAAVLHLGARTLQRRLNEAGTRFQAVLDETLKQAAETYLRQPELSLAEIAWLLGYVEQASFFRAFKRWHETTPDDFRRRLSALPTERS